MQTLEDVSKLGKDMVDSGLKSFAAVSKSAQAIAVEATEFSKKTFETNSAMVERLMGAKSLDKAIEIQTDFMKTSYESFVSESAKMSDLFATMAKQAYTPFEMAAARVK